MVYELRTNIPLMTPRATEDVSMKTTTQMLREDINEGHTVSKCINLNRQGGL